MLMIALMAAGIAGYPADKAECGAAASDTQRAACLRVELAQSDETINTTYAALKARLDDAGRLVLRDAQRAWIRRRDAVCGIEQSEGDRAAWLADLSRDYARTVCVVRFTGGRVAQLQAQLAAPEPASAPAPVAASTAPAEASYDLRARMPQSTGKWYFETALRVGALADAAEQAIFIGERGPGGGSLGTLQTIHRRDAGAPDRNVGVAVDLDNGKLYIRTNGVWREGGPATSGGLDVKLGRPYVAWVSSSAALDHAVGTGAIDVNLGQRPFVYAIPDGYLPMDGAPAITVPPPPGS